MIYQEFLLSLGVRKKNNMAEEKDRLFKNLSEFMTGAYECDPEVQAAEFAQLTKLEKANVASIEYIAAGSYPAGKFSRNNMLLTLRYKNKVYYPIVGWDPDAASPYAEEGKIPPMRKWLNKLPKKRLHNSKENKTYVLYG